jgi:DNA polymerase
LLIKFHIEWYSSSFNDSTGAVPVTHSVSSPLLAASIRHYLHSLQESGLDGIPVGMAGRTGEAPVPQPLPKASQPVPESRQQPAEPLQTESLEKIRKDLGDCQRCKLAKMRKNLVFGVGNPSARLVFVGEGPGADEDLKGEPFVGEAGQVLNRIITAMGLKREDVYICNVVKCRPPGNRDPESDEIADIAKSILIIGFINVINCARHMSN